MAPLIFYPFRKNPLKMTSFSTFSHNALFSFSEKCHIALMKLEIPTFHFILLLQAEQTGFMVLRNLFNYI